MVKWRWSECKEEYTAILNGMIIALLIVLFIVVVQYTLDVQKEYLQCVQNLQQHERGFISLNVSNITMPK